MQPANRTRGQGRPSEPLSCRRRRAAQLALTPRRAGYSLAARGRSSVRLTLLCRAHIQRRGPRHLRILHSEVTGASAPCQRGFVGRIHKLSASADRSLARLHLRHCARRNVEVKDGTLGPAVSTTDGDEAQRLRPTHDGENEEEGVTSGAAPRRSRLSTAVRHLAERHPGAE